MSSADPRPRPQYGEYASPEEALAAARARDPWAPPAGPPVTPPEPARPVRGMDRPWTVVLLAVGGFMTVYAVLSMTSLQAGFAQLYTVYGFEGSHAPTTADTVAAVVVVASHVLLLVGATVIARRRLRAGRVAFWVPLVAGAIAAVVFFTAFAFVILADPQLAEFLRTGTLP